MRMPIAARMSNFGIVPKITMAARLGQARNQEKIADLSQALLCDYGATCGCWEVFLGFGILLALLGKRERSVASPDLLRPRA